MSATALQQALHAIGLTGAIDAHGAVAVLRTGAPAILRDAGLRATAVRLASQHGFRSLAIELDAPGASPVSQIPDPGP